MFSLGRVFGIYMVAGMKKMLLEGLGQIFGRRQVAAEDEAPLAKYVERGCLYPKNRLMRLGTVYGGWWIPTDVGLTEASICYLAGAGEDLSFDCALVRRFRCCLRIIDPTPRAVQHFQRMASAVAEGKRFPINNSETEFYDIGPEHLAGIRFLPVGLADRDVEMKFFLPRNPEHVSCSTMNLQRTDDYFTAQCYRLSTLMAEQKDEVVDLLKMDIEGAEYSVIGDLVENGPMPRVLLVEFDEAHTPLDGHAGERIGEHMRKLDQAGMRCIAIEGSNATFVRLGGLR